MKLTSRGRYALQSLLDMITHSEGKAVRLQDISDRQDISLFYMEQLFRQLRNFGVVKSVRGPGGGYVLAKDPKDIRVLDVLQGVNELTNYSNKIELSDKSTQELKKLSSYLTELDAFVEEGLELSLEELAR